MTTQFKASGAGHILVAWSRDGLNKAREIEAMLRATFPFMDVRIHDSPYPEEGTAEWARATEAANREAYHRFVASPVKDREFPNYERRPWDLPLMDDLRNCSMIITVLGADPSLSYYANLEQATLAHFHPDRPRVLVADPENFSAVQKPVEIPSDWAPVPGVDVSTRWHLPGSHFAPYSTGLLCFTRSGMEVLVGVIVGLVQQGRVAAILPTAPELDESLVSNFESFMARHPFPKNPRADALLLGRIAFDAKDYGKAAILLDEHYVGLPPDFPASVRAARLYESAEAFFHARKFDDALRRLSLFSLLPAEARSDIAVQATHLRALVLLNTGDWELSSKLLVTLRQQLDGTGAYELIGMTTYDLGRCLMAGGRFVEAVSMMKEAVANFETSRSMPQLGRALGQSALAMIRLGKFDQSFAPAWRSYLVFRDLNDIESGRMSFRLMVEARISLGSRKFEKIASMAISDPQERADLLHLVERAVEGAGR